MHILRQSADIVMCFYFMTMFCAGAFNHIRINRPLHEKLSAKFSCFFFKYPNEGPSDNAPFLFRIDNSLKSFEEDGACADDFNLHMKMGTKDVFQLFCFMLTHQSRINIYGR